ncbi:MAG TPA: serine hydrolase [Candidatus Elarobacter sp.]|nr:serine hydrolase [Candidatus Elarobacter sp.]
MNVEAAAEYAERHALHAFVVQQGGEIVFERYGGGYDAGTPHALYSGTKSFWGVLAGVAQEETLLELDEPVARTIPGWSTGTKARVTLRELLQLTSGIGFGGLGASVPVYDAALAVELKNEPGTTFTYGGIPLQVFGAVLAAKLAPRGLTPHAYLHERILDPIGLRVGRWRTLRDGTQPLPTGAFVTAREWLKYGLLIRDRGVWQGRRIVAAPAVEGCLRGSAANPRYGLGWWLSPLPAQPDVVYASGSGGQAMYVVPSAGAVVVKFGASSSYKHDALLKRLLGR